jgi:phage baseplate assembly protein gpV
MSRVMEVIRRVVEQEVAQYRTCALGVVTATFPHTEENDEHNYEINVRLKHEDLELRKVPLAVTHMGIATLPKVGDLVLVEFINGDLNQPVVTATFYHADERPPFHQNDELLLEQRVKGDSTLNHLRFTPNGTIFIQRDVKKPEDNSEAKTSIKIDGETGNIEIKVGEKITVLISDAEGINITATDKAVQVTSKTLAIKADDEINLESAKINIKGETKIDGVTTITKDTTIEGNGIVKKDLTIGTGMTTKISKNEITGGPG